MERIDKYIRGLAFDKMIAYKQNRKKRWIHLSERMMYALLLLAALVQGVSADEGHDHSSPAVTETPATTQEYCPIMKENKIDPEIFTEYQGKKVYFCCDFCQTAFQREPEKYVDNLPQFSKVVQEQSIKNDQPDQDSSDVHVQDKQATGHDHTTDHNGEVHGLNRLIRFLGKFHLVAVHFPIALILVAALAEVFVLVKGGTFYVAAARYCLILAALGAVGAVLLGLAAEKFARYIGELHEVLETHKLLGIITAIIIVITASLSEIARRTQRQSLCHIYRILLLAAVILAGITGYWGGTLVYGPDHYTW